MSVHTFPGPPALTPDQIINDFLSQDIDLLQMERMQFELLTHFLRPTNDWKLAPDWAREAIDMNKMLIRHLRQIAAFRNH